MQQCTVTVKYKKKKYQVHCVMIVKQTFGLVSKGFNLQKPRATYTSQNGVFTERVR